MKTFSAYYLLLIFIAVSISSCTEKKDITGSLYVSMAINNNECEQISELDDVDMIVYNSSLDSLRIMPVTAAQFRIDNLPLGEKRIVLRKPGYIEVSSSSIVNTGETDTLNKILLIKELPFSYSEFSASYQNERVTFLLSTDYTTDDTYLTGDVFCFGKQRSVSINESLFTMPAGYFPANSVSNDMSFTTSLSKSLLQSKGFTTNDTVFIVAYPINFCFEWLLDEQEDDPGITLKMTNPSPIAYFIME